MILAATPDSVYRAPQHPFDEAERVLDVGAVRKLAVADGSSAVFAATATGLYRTSDDGGSWVDLGVPVEDVHSVLLSDGFIYAGVRPARIYRSSDGGETWRELTGFKEPSFTSSWPTNPHREHAQVRSLASPQTAPNSLVAGVEVGGVVLSSDRGTSWRECPAVPDDVHHVLCITADRWIVSCGTGGPDGNGGVYQTEDKGETWERLDTGTRPYVREACYHDRLYIPANRTAPLWNPPDATLRIERTDGFESVSYPGEPTSFVISWATAGDQLLAGTNDGRILRGRGSEWVSLGAVPVSPDNQQAYGVTSLVTTEDHLRQFENL
jgi:photosystem II stability/assembly factor-like uncharacterized protein